MALPARQLLHPAVHAFEVLLYTWILVLLPPLELKSLDIRGLGAWVQQLLFQTPCGRLNSPVHIQFHPGEYSAIFPFDNLFLLIVDLIRLCVYDTIISTPFGRKNGVI